MADVTIKVSLNGPLRVTGEVDLVDQDGNPIAVTGPSFALCRCGASTRKPFCDGAHSKIGFDAAAVAVPESKE